MPTQAGVYPGGLVAGTEVSSTYEGRHLTVLESELIHPYRASDLVVKGDPVIVALTKADRPHVHGQAVGVALNSAAAITDLITIDTEGIFNLNVNADDDGANADVNPGDALYISDDSAGSNDDSHDGVGDAVLSKITNEALQTPFGYALGYIGNGAYGVIAVKVHFDPLSPVVYLGDKLWNGEDVLHYMNFDASEEELLLQEISIRGIVTTIDPDIPDGTGVVANFIGHVAGTPTGHFAASDSWAMIDDGVTLAGGGSYVCAQQNGVYSDTATTTGSRLIIGMRMHRLITNDPGANPGGIFPFSLNTDNKGITALFDVATVTDIGDVVDAGSDSGHLIPILRDFGGNMRYVKVYTHT